MNKKYIIIFGVFMLLIIAFFGFEGYRQEKEQEKEIETGPVLLKNINFETIFDRNYPVSLEETILLNKFCSDVNLGISDQEQKFEPILCKFVESEEPDVTDTYKFIPKSLKTVPSLTRGDYLVIAINYSDLLRENSYSVTQDDNFNICVTIKPFLSDPFRGELFKLSNDDDELLKESKINFNYNAVFSEGEIFCSEFSGLPPETLNFITNGVLGSEQVKAQSFELKMYFVPEVTDDSVFHESFINIEEMLQSYPLLWGIEKSII